MLSVYKIISKILSCKKLNSLEDNLDIFSDMNHSNILL